MSVSLFKNAAGQSFFFELLTAAGAPVTSGAVTGYVTKDVAAQGALAGTITHVGNGQYRVDLTQADTNADTLGYLFTHATGVPVNLSVRTTAAAAAATALAGTWSYDPTLMTSTTAGAYAGSTVGLRNQIRFVIQDIQAARPLMVDAEVDWAQTLEANQYMAAALCCEILVARAGNIRSKRVGALSLDYDVEFYRGLAATLRARGLSNQVPYCGGISISDKLAQQDNGDWVPPRFFRGMFDNPRAQQPSAGSVQNQTGYNSPGAY
jgi:hypothetical protein